jgi:hypothetical protein
MEKSQHPKEIVLFFRSWTIVVQLILLIFVIAFVLFSLFETYLFKLPIFQQQFIDAGEKKFFDVLEKSINKDYFDQEYCKIIFNSIDRDVKGTLLKYGYIELLEDFLVYLDNKKEKIEKVKIERLNTIIKEAKQIEPYAALPSEERRLMNTLQLFINQENWTNALNMLNELKSVILIRHQEYEKIENKAKWSNRLAFIGVSFTFIFGIWTIILSFKRRRADYHKLKNQ